MLKPEKQSHNSRNTLGNECNGSLEELETFRDNQSDEEVYQ